MHKFNVTVRTGMVRHRFTLWADHSADLVIQMQETFDLCAVLVVPA